MARLLAALASCALTTLACAGSARAASATTPNACKYTGLVDEYRNQPITLSGTGSPNGAAAGATAVLSGASVSARLPEALPRQGFEVGIFSAGLNTVPVRVWVALRGAGLSPGTQVFALTAMAFTTIAVDGGGAFASSTPLELTIPIPDSSWTVTGAEPVAFLQAAPGALAALPVGIDDQLTPVEGSIVIAPKLDLRFILDCSPGSTAGTRKTYTALAPAPFAILEAAAPVAPVPPPAVPAAPVVKPVPGPRVASSALRVRAGKAGVVVACPATSPSACRGTVALRSASRVRYGGRRQTVTLAVRGTFVVPAGHQRTTRLRLTKSGRALLRSRRSLLVRVTLAPAAGAAAGAELRLSR